MTILYLRQMLRLNLCGCFWWKTSEVSTCLFQFFTEEKSICHEECQEKNIKRTRILNGCLSIVPSSSSRLSGSRSRDGARSRGKGWESCIHKASLTTSQLFNLSQKATGIQVLQLVKENWKVCPTLPQVLRRGWGRRGSSGLQLRRTPTLSA